MTTHMWAEKPRGTWRLTIGLDPKNTNYKSGKAALGHAILTEWILVVHGTQKSPYAGLPDSASELIPKLGMVKRQHDSKRFDD